MIKQIITLATLVIIEALHTRFFMIIFAFLLTGFGIVSFVGQIAIIETVAYQSSLLAAFLRLSAIYIISLFVIVSMVNEFNNNAIHLWLSLPMKRATYLIGKFSGFMLIACIIAILFGLSLFILVPYSQAGLWTFSLFCELLIIAALSLLCVFTFHNTIQALSAVIAFYILARSIYSIQLVAQNLLNSSQSWSDYFIAKFIYLLSIILPNLEQFTQSDWLTYYSGEIIDLLQITAQTIIYVILLISMSMFDLYRKNL
ncbi:MAG: hypothetical protein KAH84_03355 [Thiomargarita sp.]|nr:hypothetical protein [Thiomargarita sp.]